MDNEAVQAHRTCCDADAGLRSLDADRLPLVTGKRRQAPPKTCAAISYQEYAAAKKQKLLRSQFGSYVRTGGLGRRQYWYCKS